MRRFYFTLQVTLPTHVIHGNHIIEVAGLLPNHEDMERAKREYCELLRGHGFIANYEKAVITFYAEMESV